MHTKQATVLLNAPELRSRGILNLFVAIAAFLAVLSPGDSFAQNMVKKFVIITSDACNGEFSWTSEAQAIRDLKGECAKSAARKKDAMARQLGTHISFSKEVNWMLIPHMRTFKGVSKETRYKALQGSMAYEYYYYVKR